MQQRQLRLGDILDDYCPRERRVTNHAVVAMVGEEVKQTRCTTCDADHEYKQAKVPRQRRKSDAPAALYAQVLAGGPKRVVPDAATPESEPSSSEAIEAETAETVEAAADSDADLAVPDEERDAEAPDDVEDGPVHRPLIRATLPRTEGQPPPQRPAPEFTIRQPGGRQNRFRHRPAHQGFQGNRSSGGGGGPMRSGMPRQGGGRPPLMSHTAKRQGGRKRSK